MPTSSALLADLYELTMAAGYVETGLNARATFELPRLGYSAEMTKRIETILFDLKGMLDFTVGAPHDCTLAINLMLQISPLLASMSCLLKILAVIKAMEKFVKNPLTETTELLEKIGDVAGCFVALIPLNVAITIKGILELIISFLSCFLEQLESLITFQASIDLNAAKGNETLRLTLECAKENAQTAMDNLTLSLESIQPLLGLTTSLGAVVGIDVKLPSLASISAQKDQTQAITSLKEAVDAMRQAIQALPQ